MHQFPDNPTGDYRRVAAAIDYLRERRREQPALTELAAHLGLSEAHVQKLFSRWAGISPKRFLQFLTVEYAKTRLLADGDLLGVALDAGLSGAGRLHDLFVNMEAMSPGEFKRAAAGVTVRYGSQATPFGTALIASTERGICHLSFADPAQQRAVLAELQARWPGACFERDTDHGSALLQRIFAVSGSAAVTPLSLWVSGTNFQIQVWRALLDIPFGELRSYRQIAQAVGRPRAARAVGTAIAGNPVAFLIPCHRVLQSSGRIGDYHWGTTRKAALVAWEAALAGD